MTAIKTPPPAPAKAPKAGSTFLNEATWDRVLRVAVGIVLLYLGWSGAVVGILGALCKYVGFLPLVTGLAGWCPAYSVFGVKTCGS